MKSVICKILENRNLGENYYLLEFENKFDKTFQPGNFVHIKIENNFLRRPFSVAGYNRRIIQIVYKIVGGGTEKLSKKRKGEFLDILGPLGNSFPIVKNKKVSLVGGGTGIAPLLFLAKKLKEYENEVYFFYGVRNKNCIFFDILPYGINYIFSTDDGSFGEKGDIFKVFKKFDDFDIIYSAGPKPLLKKISKYSLKIPVYVSVENYMACGMGLCFGCVIKIKENSKWEYKRVCKEGPVFEAKSIIWE
ncbi:MAG: dihydroorotate dehydrogenase electron transfer subunit [bacterium]|nr:dihydroorotate dehydrogenase electron transfer subunit [bacterium]MDW8163237.1 dihydroorotate dehydrogenase electron transfer subunit [Candidatus Omnitrophota bacterium]